MPAAHLSASGFIVTALLWLVRECLCILETLPETFQSTEVSASCFHKIKRNIATEKITLCVIYMTKKER